jgi:hypothetical protein
MPKSTTATTKPAANLLTLATAVTTTITAVVVVFSVTIGAASTTGYISAVDIVATPTVGQKRKPRPWFHKGLE